MRSVKKQGSGIRIQLLDSACKVFAEKGYRDATIAEICELAGANIAAVNYYFGDKETLYVNAWRQAFHQSLEAYPPDGGVGPDAPVEERFRGRIFAVMQRFASPKNYEFEIMSKELANPTGLLAEVMRESIEPLRREFSSIIQKLLGEYASEQQVMLCQMSIMAQCINLMVHERRRKSFAAAGMKTGLLPENLKIEIMADHVTRFSLAGIREIRRQIETGELTRPNNMAAMDYPKN
jgi:TetR/AcrR family transcriptional regulator, regulator of cefoperazone and chloramphenicol sensitivity